MTGRGVVLGVRDTPGVVRDTKSGKCLYEMLFPALNSRKMKNPADGVVKRLELRECPFKHQLGRFAFKNL
jgi:hypothetical protein